MHKHCLSVCGIDATGRGFMCWQERTHHSWQTGCGTVVPKPHSLFKNSKSFLSNSARNNRFIDTHYVWRKLFGFIIIMMMFSPPLHRVTSMGIAAADARSEELNLMKMLLWMCVRQWILTLSSIACTCLVNQCPSANC